MSKQTIKRHLSRTLYSLKRRWPTAIQIHCIIGDPVTDYDSGITTVNSQTFKVRRGIELPRNSVRKFVYDLAYIASNNNFTYGALFDQATKVVIIDRKDLPKTFEVTIDMTATVEGERYQFNTVSELPYRTGYAIGLIRSKSGVQKNDSY